MGLIFEVGKIIEADEVVIYGYGDLGKEVLSEIETYNNKILIIDKKVINHSKYKTYALEEFPFERNCKRIFVVASELYYKVMTDNLVSKGVKENDIVYPYKVTKKQIADYKMIIDKRKPRKDFRFVVCITEHCNLNCAYCDHFSPVSDEWYMSIEAYESDIRRMAEIFGKEVAQINIAGGEPLLHKDVIKFMRVARNYFASPTVLKLHTNAILLNKMDSEFFEECKRLDFVIRVTKYPIKIDYAKIEELVKSYGVEYEYANDEFNDKDMCHQKLDSKGMQNKYESFHACYMANGECAELRLGKFYQCNIIANLHILNRRFNAGFIETKNDYIDIYSDVCKEDFYDYLCKPADACKYCKTKEWLWGNKWRISTKEVVEWIE